MTAAIIGILVLFALGLGSMGDANRAREEENKQLQQQVQMLEEKVKEVEAPKELEEVKQQEVVEGK